MLITEKTLVTGLKACSYCSMLWMPEVSKDKRRQGAINEVRSVAREEREREMR